MRIIISGSAGFIGFHLSLKLLDDNNVVIGIDSLNDYYDVKLKQERLKLIKSKAKEVNSKFVFFKIDLTQTNALKEVFDKYNSNKN